MEVKWESVNELNMPGFEMNELSRERTARNIFLFLRQRTKRSTNNLSNL